MHSRQIWTTGQRAEFCLRAEWRTHFNNWTTAMALMIALDRLRLNGQKGFFFQPDLLSVWVSDVSGAGNTGWEARWGEFCRQEEERRFESRPWWTWGQGYLLYCFLWVHGLVKMPGKKPNQLNSGLGSKPSLWTNKELKSDFQSLHCDKVWLTKQRWWEISKLRAEWIFFFLFEEKEDTIRSKNADQGN